MKTTTAAITALAVALGGAHHCGEAFLASAPARSGTSASVRARSWAAAASTCPAPRAGATGLSMVSATFGEKINTDRIVLDKTAREAIEERYPEASAKCPTFLGEGNLILSSGVRCVHVSKLRLILQFNRGQPP